MKHKRSAIFLMFLQYDNKVVVHCSLFIVHFSFLIVPCSLLNRTTTVEFYNTLDYNKFTHPSPNNEDRRWHTIWKYAATRILTRIFKYKTYNHVFKSYQNSLSQTKKRKTSQPDQHHRTFNWSRLLHFNFSFCTGWSQVRQIPGKFSKNLQTAK